jgi:hypothetical protein
MKQIIRSTLEFVNTVSKVLYEKPTICLTPLEDKEQAELTDLAFKNHYGEKANYNLLVCYVIDEKIKQLEKLKEVI